VSPARRRARNDGPPAVPRLYSPTEVAKVLGCSEWWVKEQARKRRIPFSWIGGSYRFTADHLNEIIQVFEVRPERDHSTATSARAPRRPTYRPTAPTSRLEARPPRNRGGGPGSSAA